MSKIRSRNSAESALKSVVIKSNDGKHEIDIVSSITELCYFESLMMDSISVKLSFVDTGSTEKLGGKTIKEVFPLTGTEVVNLKLAQNLNDEEEIVLGGKKEMVLYVNDFSPMYEDSRKNLIVLDLRPKEYIKSQNMSTGGTFYGLISDNVEKILKEELETEKEIDIEPTINTRNFTAYHKRPLYLLNWLSKQSVSSEHQTLGKSAGYFLFETAEGYKYKSIDGLLNQNNQKQKKSYIYNNTPDTQVPAGYNGNVLDFDNTNLINVQQKSKMGTYSNRIVLFDPFNTFYEVKKNKADDENVKTSGKKLPVFNSEFDIDYTRTSYFVLDTGTFPEGNVDQQLEKSQDQNFSHGEIVNQSFMRYNQFFSSQVSITIPGDFELHVGELIFVDAPQLNAEKSDEVDRQSGGLYIISDLCHYITPKEFRTELTLVRDSFGRKGNHTTSI